MGELGLEIDLNHLLFTEIETSVYEFLCRDWYNPLSIFYEFITRCLDGSV